MASGDKIKNNQSNTVMSWPDWHMDLRIFSRSNSLKAIWQMFNTLLPYGFLWYLMVRSIQQGYSYLITLALALPASALLVRIFILFHDCVHGSFLKSKKLNKVLGNVFGLLVFTPFEDWRYSHLKHHASSANLDARGFGDIWTLTKNEYLGLGRSKRFFYRLYRNPLVLFVLGPFYLFFISNRFPTRQGGKREIINVIQTNLLIVALAWVVSDFIGWGVYLKIQLPVLWLSGIAGIWLFYVQHQFPGGYWAHRSEWQYFKAAMEGSSYYRLPAVLRWFSGNIGFHHVHHLHPAIPNYTLKKCFDSLDQLQSVKPLTLIKSLACSRLKIWDETNQTMNGIP